MDFKKTIVVCATIVCAIFLSSCADETTFDPEFKTAIVTTSSTENRTEMIYLDSDFDVVYREKLEYAEWGYPEGETAISNGKYYAAPRGKQGKYDEKKLVEIDLKTGQVSENMTKEELAGPTSISCDDEYISLCANLNGKSYVGVCGIGEKKFSTRVFPMDTLGCVREVYSYKGKVLACTSDTNEKEQFYCYIIDPQSLEIEKTVLLQGYAVSFYGYDDTVYISEDATEGDGAPRYLVGEYDVKTGGFKEQEIESKDGISGVKRCKDHLILIDSDHFDLEKGLEAGRLIVTDLDYDVVTTEPLKAAVSQSIMDGNDLYLLQRKEGDVSYLTKYRIGDDGSIEKDKELRIDDIVDDTTGMSFFVNKGVEK